MKKTISNLQFPWWDGSRGEPSLSRSARQPTIGNWQLGIANARAFTLLELLVVISILGILAALSVPALKNLGKSNVQVSAVRQLLDDFGHARQMAVSQHTTVYMVFVPAIWNLPTSLQTTAMTNLLDKQYAGYNFLTLRSVGDQPGRGTTNYLAEWKSLPDGAFIATNKFNLASYPPKLYSGSTYYPIIDYSIGATYPISSFYYSTNFPFPLATNAPAVSLPYIAFNYLGQLTVLTPAGEVSAPQDEYVPIAQGTVGYAADANKALMFAAPDASENLPGNSTNSMFNVIRIDRLTGRAVQLHQKIQ